MDIYGEIAGFKNPVLIMHGTADNVVDYSYSEKANRVYENSELVAFEKRDTDLIPRIPKSSEVCL